MKLFLVMVLLLSSLGCSTIDDYYFLDLPPSERVSVLDVFVEEPDMEVSLHRINGTRVPRNQQMARTINLQPGMNAVELKISLPQEVESGENHISASWKIFYRTLRVDADKHPQYEWIISVDGDQISTELRRL